MLINRMCMPVGQYATFQNLGIQLDAATPFPVHIDFTLCLCLDWKTAFTRFDFIASNAVQSDVVDYLELVVCSLWQRLLCFTPKFKISLHTPVNLLQCSLGALVYTWGNEVLDNPWMAFPLCDIKGQAVLLWPYFEVFNKIS